MTARFSGLLTLTAIALLGAASAQAAVVTHSVTANQDGTTTVSKTTQDTTAVITPVGSDDSYVTSDDPIYPVTSTTTTTTYVNGRPVQTSYSREVNHPDDEYSSYYVNRAPASTKTYAVGVDENVDATTPRYENRSAGDYNN